MDELRTERLRLRAFRADDWSAVHAYGGDPEVVRFMDWGPNTPQDTTAHVDRVIAAARVTTRQRHPYAIERCADGRMIGSVELAQTSVEHRRGEMGYVLARDAWGRGYATEAAAALLAYGFASGLHRISATCDPENAASARVLEKIGMSFEGRLRAYFLVRGAWRDRLLYAVVKEAVVKEAVVEA